MSTEKDTTMVHVMPPDVHAKMHEVVQEIADERILQHMKWGVQDYPNGTSVLREQERRAAQAQCAAAQAHGVCTWMDILHEEVCEAFAETDPERLRAELVQVAAVAVQWIEQLDRRRGL